MTNLNKLAEKLEKKIAQASLQSFMSLANIAKATSALAKMKNLFANSSEIDIYEGTGNPVALMGMLDSTARNLYLKAYQQGVGRSEMAGGLAKMMDLIEKLDSAAKNAKSEDNHPLDPQFWSKLSAVKSAMQMVIPMDIAPQVPVRRPAKTVEEEPMGQAKKKEEPIAETDMTDPYVAQQRYQTKVAPELTDVVDSLMQEKDKPTPWDVHWDNYLK